MDRLRSAPAAIFLAFWYAVRDDKGERGDGQCLDDCGVVVPGEARENGRGSRFRLVCSVLEECDEERDSAGSNDGGGVSFVVRKVRESGRGVLFGHVILAGREEQSERGNGAGLDDGGAKVARDMRRRASAARSCCASLPFCLRRPRTK